MAIPLLLHKKERPPGHCVKRQGENGHTLRVKNPHVLVYLDKKYLHVRSTILRNLSMTAPHHSHRQAQPVPTQCENSPTASSYIGVSKHTVSM